MAEDEKKKSLVAGLLETIPQTSQKLDPRRKRYRRCKSAPMAEYVPGEINGTEQLQHSESFFGQVHPSLRQVAFVLLIYLSLGTICFFLVRHQIKGDKTNDVLDSVYFCIVTMTTVGYGDLVPNSVASKLLACAFVFSGMVLIGLILSKAADYLVEKQEFLLVKAMHMHRNVGPSEILKEVETNRTTYKCFVAIVILVLLIVSGTVVLATVEKLDIIDAFYCVCATITTLGYGDKSFSTRVGRIFAIFWILISTLCLAQFFLYIAEVNTESRQRALVNWVLNKKMTNVDLEAADIDRDGVVEAAEFALYKLKEMGKISQEDISLVLDEFENLDVDQSGTLSVSDLNLAQYLKR